MAATTTDNKTILVQTKSGPIRGRQRISCESIGFVSFQGIPYAKPPIGPLRFKVNYINKLLIILNMISVK